MAYLVNRAYRPQPFAGFGTDVQRTETGYTVQIPVPGFAPDQIEATLEENVLTVKGETEHRHFSRSFQIPDEIDAETIGAKVEHGLLTLSLHVQPKLAPRKIQVSAN